MKELTDKELIEKVASKMQGADELGPAYPLLSMGNRLAETPGESGRWAKYFESILSGELGLDEDLRAHFIKVFAKELEGEEQKTISSGGYPVLVTPEFLRNAAKNDPHCNKPYISQLVVDCANRIAAMEAENARLRELTTPRPFRDVCEAAEFLDAQGFETEEAMYSSTSGRVFIAIVDMDEDQTIRIAQAISMLPSGPVGESEVQG
jgi:hypothetical protein